MLKVCTTCANGSYDYSEEKLYCKGEVKTTNTPCDNWTEKESTCRVTYPAWNSLKKGGRYHG